MWHISQLNFSDQSRFNRYPLIIDPSGQATEFIMNEYQDRKITKTSFLDDSFRKNLESGNNNKINISVRKGEMSFVRKEARFVFLKKTGLDQKQKFLK